MRTLAYTMALAAFVAAAGCTPVRNGINPPTPTDSVGLRGTWQLVAINTRWSDGRMSQPWGPAPIGQLTYAADGRMTALLMDDRRNQANGQPVPADVQANVAAYYGTYAVDSLRHTVTHHVVASIRASEAGAIERTYRLKGDTLVLTAAAIYEGASVIHTLVWHRVAQLR
jgi:hypothetical protein